MKSNQHEQLFAELTPDQASVIEGGKTLFIQKIQCVTSSADDFFGGNDDTYITVNGSFLSGVFSMRSSTTRSVNKNVSFNGSARIELFDQDGGLLGNDDDSVGGFTATNPTNGIVSKQVSGSGSKYNVFYSVSPSAQITPGSGVLAP